MLLILNRLSRDMRQVMLRTGPLDIVRCVACVALRVVGFGTRCFVDVIVLQQHAMAPKGSRKPPSLVGGVIKRKTIRNTFYRVQVSLALVGSKKTVCGPQRGSWAMAKRDLEFAQTASNHREMDELLRALRNGSKRGRAQQDQIALGTAMEKGAEVTATCRYESLRADYFCYGSHPPIGVRLSRAELFMQRIDEIRTWVSDHMGRLPKRRSGDAREHILAKRYGQYKMRCMRDLRCVRKFRLWEKLYFDRIDKEVVPFVSPSHSFMRRVDEIRTWVIEHMGRLPKQLSGDAHERTLAGRYAYFKMRGSRDLRTRRGIVRKRKFQLCEKAYYDRIEEVLIA